MNKYEVISNEPIALKTYKMILKGDTSNIVNPGQFINIKIDSTETFLRRPISISDYNDTTITIVYKILGVGTKIMSTMEVGTKLDILSPLGNGFTVKENNHALLVGGGVGVPPLYNLAKQLLKSNVKTTVVLGFNTSDEVFYYDEFKNLGLDVYISTMDGSKGVKGTVIDALKEHKLQYDYFYSCGPHKMLEAMYHLGVAGQLSFEERMGCGFGACMGCSCKTITGYKRICKEGPVLETSEVIL